MMDYEINHHDVVLTLRIYGCDSQEEANQEVKEQVETGLWVEGISGTSVITVGSKQSQ